MLCYTDFLMHIANPLYPQDRAVPVFNASYGQIIDQHPERIVNKNRRWAFLAAFFNNSETPFFLENCLVIAGSQGLELLHYEDSLFKTVYFRPFESRPTNNAVFSACKHALFWREGNDGFVLSPSFERKRMIIEKFEEFFSHNNNNLEFIDFDRSGCKDGSFIAHNLFDPIEARQHVFYKRKSFGNYEAFPILFWNETIPTSSTYTMRKINNDYFIVLLPDRRDYYHPYRKLNANFVGTAYSSIKMEIFKLIFYDDKKCKVSNLCEESYWEYVFQNFFINDVQFGQTDETLYICALSKSEIIGPETIAPNPPACDPSRTSIPGRMKPNLGYETTYIYAINMDNYSGNCATKIFETPSVPKAHKQEPTNVRHYTAAKFLREPPQLMQITNNFIVLKTYKYLNYLFFQADLNKSYPCSEKHSPESTIGQFSSSGTLHARLFSPNPK